MHYITVKQRKAETRDQAMPDAHLWGSTYVSEAYLLKALPAGKRHSEQEPVGTLQGQTTITLLTVAQYVSSRTEV